MVTQQVILTTTLVAAAALTQQRLVGGDGKPCAAGLPALGVAEVDAQPGDAVPINVLGILVVEAGAALTAGQSVQSDGNGCAIPLVTGKSPVGMALDAAAAAGDLVRLLRGV
ncbi:MULTISPECIES: DUF2190 family protein [unclassified Serratia]|uniref:DUF2190 family protein n=1 Tax=unclassified Serratia (in: enterobacteria) TaxID=2647522 RepID=UPI00050815E2|nr:membrane protein [Serratia sp. Ag2]KFK91931.1 membrane protein [Serratia sp. Ag2]KFK98573.1 membrane protein [Serratia sp. Ag1]